MKKILKAIIVVIVFMSLSVGALEVFSSYKQTKDINKDAPVQTVKRITIMAPAEKLYRMMADVNNWHNWHPEVEDTKMTSSFIPGHSFTWKSDGLNIKSTIHTATAYSKLGWSGRALGAFAIHNWSFIPKGKYTEVVVTESMEGWLVSLMRSKFQKGLEQSLDVWLSRLKAEAER